MVEHRHLEAEHGGDDYLLDTDILERNHKWLECVCQESMRIAQQSITLRKVGRVCWRADGRTLWRLGEGGRLMNHPTHRSRS